MAAGEEHITRGSGGRKRGTAGHDQLDVTTCATALYVPRYVLLLLYLQPSYLHSNIKLINSHI